jgi:hypothetical protein
MVQRHREPDNSRLERGMPQAGVKKEAAVIFRRAVAKLVASLFRHAGVRL